MNPAINKKELIEHITKDYTFKNHILYLWHEFKMKTFPKYRAKENAFIKELNEFFIRQQQKENQE